MKKLRVGILFGGRSAEHEVSLQSARNILRAIDRGKYEPVLVAIDANGRWGVVTEEGFMALFNGDNVRPSVPPIHPEVLSTIAPGAPNGLFLSPGQGGGRPEKIDVVFPALHGTYGEDGTVQGLLKLVDIPFVGPGVLGSAACMDKDVMKRLLRDASIPTPEFVAYPWDARGSIGFAEVKRALGLPLFVKPANLGSSVGISKVKSEGEFQRAVDLAFRFDAKIVIEEFIRGRELECSVLGNERPVASVLGEVKPLHEFYSYEAKYVDEKGALLEIPARVTEAQKREVQDLAVRSFRALCCEGMARVDFFLSEGGEVLVNELNTIPGFTAISMYPMLWEASGVPKSALIDRLIGFALERYEREKKVRTSVFDEK